MKLTTEMGLKDCSGAKNNPGHRASSQPSYSPDSLVAFDANLQASFSLGIVSLLIALSMWNGSGCGPKPRRVVAVAPQILLSAQELWTEQFFLPGYPVDLSVSSLGR